MEPSSVEGEDHPFGVGYARSSRSTCKGCKNAIQQDVLRMSVREPSRYFDGLQDNWFHFSCFWKTVLPLRVEINEKSTRGIDAVRWDDQERIREKIIQVESGCFGEDKGFSALNVEYARTSRGKCAKCDLLIVRNEIMFSKSDIWYHQKCLFDGTKYEGLVKEIEGFNSLKSEDQLLLLEVPKEFHKEVKKSADEVKGKYSLKARKRKATKNGSSSKGSENGIDDEEALKKQTEIIWKIREDMRQNLSKYGMQCLLLSNGQPNLLGASDILEHLVDCAVFGCCNPCPKCRGNLRFNDSLMTYECHGQLSEYTKCTYKDENPCRKKFVIPADYRKENAFLKKLKVNLLTKRTYNGVSAREAIVERAEAFKMLGYRGHVDDCDSSVCRVSQMTVKNGAIVEPKCGFAKDTHVHWNEGGTMFTAVLGHVDMQSSKNSYYKIQLLRHDMNKTVYYLFRSWGRVGTRVGGNKTETFYDEHTAIAAFEHLFFGKTGNRCDEKDKFEKKPGLMGLIDTDFSGLDGSKKYEVVPGSKTKLDRAIKEIIIMVFDTSQLKKTMLNFQLDLEKMPLGKLSRKQIMSAYSVLSELQQIMYGNPDTDKVLDASNRFYSLIPHDFGINSPPLLNTEELIKEKCGMLDSILDMQIAYEVIKDEEIEADSDCDPVDVSYERLKCKMELVEKNSPEFEIINKYLRSTHAKTHNWYQLELVDNGYMFGKGVYFADMASKSANYCRVNTGDDGLMLLCDVALGEVKPETDARTHNIHTIEGCNSVKGIGCTEPDPNELVEMLDGSAIHMGKPIDFMRNTGLRYNEFIVYDVDQIKMRYLLRVRFNHP